MAEVYNEGMKVAFKTPVLEPVIYINPQLIHLCVGTVMQFCQCRNFLKDGKLEDKKLK
jgi:hypothetical protein